MLFAVNEKSITKEEEVNHESGNNKVSSTPDLHTDKAANKFEPALRTRRLTEGSRGEL